MLKTNIILVIITVWTYLFNLVCCRYNSSYWIEEVLQNGWILSATQFYRPAECSIVGYDSDNEKVIIIGGTTSGTNFETADWYSLYIYDLIMDKLNPIPIAWNSLHDELINPSTTNAVVVNGTMYFSTREHLFSLDLDLVYSHDLNDEDNRLHSKGQNLSSLRPQVLYGYSLDTGYIGEGCIVCDETKQYIFISGMAHDGTQSDDKFRVVLVYHITTQRLWYGGYPKYYHNRGVCMVMNDVFYIIGGSDRSIPEYIDVDELINEENIYYPNKAPHLTTFNVTSDKYGFSQRDRNGIGIISDRKNKLIYLLGGYGHNKEMYRLDVQNQTMNRLNVTLPYSGIEYATTIVSETTKRIYVFRGMEGLNSQRIGRTLSNEDINMNESENKRETSASRTWLIILLVILIGIICILGTIATGLFYMYRYIQRQTSESSTHINRIESFELNEPIQKREQLVYLCIL